VTIVRRAALGADPRVFWGRVKRAQTCDKRGDDRVTNGFLGEDARHTKNATLGFLRFQGVVEA
jgi:hypothetical protein